MKLRTQDLDARFTTSAPVEAMPGECSVILLHFAMAGLGSSTVLASHGNTGIR